MKIRMNERYDRAMVAAIMSSPMEQYPEIAESQKAIRRMKQNSFSILAQAVLGK